jgi:hypothetical protein
MPCVAIFVVAFVGWQGIFIPAGSPLPEVSLLLVSIAVTMAGIFSSELPVPDKVGLAVFTICLFPCVIVLFIFVMASVFGFSRG